MTTVDFDQAVDPQSQLSKFVTSALSSTSSTHEAHLHHLAAQVQHNLIYQHDWTDVTVHTHSSDPTPKLLPRPVISGLPPQRIYLHPDDQIELLKSGDRHAETSPEREWVLPTHLREKWSLHRFADVFDLLEIKPPQVGSAETKPDATGPDGQSWSEKRRNKRLLLATVNDDSTIVFYIIHDGIVKPRQN
ncbi:MAG: hypothetical protein M1825_006432 [Sarcosagium campestre]|nr:MAG: hypothetical protein M1825_006432 [Sarcosagium campestre]